MKNRRLVLVIFMLVLALLLSGCESKKEEPTVTPAQEPVKLTVAGSWEDCKAIETVGRAFTKLYPNCTIVYEQLQNYTESLVKRVAGEDAVNLFFDVNLQEGSTMLPYALDLGSAEGLDLSNTFSGLIDNFAFMENGVRTKKLYCIPLGAEMRGLYINKTLLDSMGIAVPTNQQTLLAACAALKEKGYIPFHGNPGSFAQMLLYPWVCNLIANAADPQAVYQKVNTRQAGTSELFREPFQFLYTLIENGYYDYKRAQTDLGLFVDSADIDYARYFFHIQKNGDTWEKASDVGQIAFMPSTISLKSVIDKVKNDYHSEIEYLFVPAPVGTDGGFAYMSPAHGIAVNKNSANLEWSVRFMNFLFQPENNKLFAQEFNIIPNTKEAFGYITTLYDVPDNRISQLGEVTFDYDLYSTICQALLEESKANNPKYMLENEDGTKTLQPLEHFMSMLEESIKGNE